MKLVTRCLAAALLAVFGFVPSAAAAQAPTPDRKDPEGLWQGVIAYDPGRIEIEVLVELARGPEGSWVGTIDVPIHRIELHPLEDISVDGSRVTFWFNRQSPTAGRVESPFRGEVSPDGTVITGEFVEGGRNHHTFELERIGDAGDPRPKPELSPVHPVSEDLAELRDAFNRHRDAVRVVLLLSPT